MNKVLELRGKFYQKPHSTPGPLTLPTNASVTVSDLQRLISSLENVLRYWTEERRLFKPLVAIHYQRIVAKSNRMTTIFKSNSISLNSTIVGAKFSNDTPPRHIFTHCMDISIIRSGLERLRTTCSLLEVNFNSRLTAEDMDILNDNTNRLKRPLALPEQKRKKQWEKAIAANNISKSRFCGIVRDAWYIDCFRVEERKQPILSSQIVTLFNTGLNAKEILRRLGMQDEPIRIIDDVTWLVTPEQYQKIISNAPYIISMSVTDFGRIGADVENIRSDSTVGLSIPDPENEPVIGVIDTLFDGKAYFSAWVEYRCMVSEDLIEEADYEHGTAVSSLIVDGPALNPFLDDGCGRFRVRHFGIAKHIGNSTAKLMEDIRNIVETNRDIKVWNLSLGSQLEIDSNFVSIEATLLDELQYTYDIIFVVAGTNNLDRQKSFPRIGAPADSINSVIVNAVTLTGKPAEYSRKGPVLYFFRKPDIAVFGGDRQDGLVVYSRSGRVKKFGTSFAAPWITRKLAFLIYIMGFSKEAAKALLFDAAAGWKYHTAYTDLMGFGIVPTRIEDILKTPDDEIKFIMQGTSQAFETYAYTIPVPMHKEQFPYIARALLCYFPKCSRSQGVDYTNTELDLHFGRLNAQGKVKSINNNVQGDDEPHKLFESDVRKEFRKWDNVKFISEGMKNRTIPKKRFYLSSPNWGIVIRAKERLGTKPDKALRFAVVITLREIGKVNRIAEFMQLCRANGWFIDEVDIHTRLHIHEKAQEELVFEEDVTYIGE
ncbi:MAG: S8 family peptidase [Sphaerochaetaceae bacterium]|nr:S8 family peptidase [Sphaerochaetaceae bacterium]